MRTHLTATLITLALTTAHAVPLNQVTNAVRGAQQQVLAYFPTLQGEALATALVQASTVRGVNTYFITDPAGFSGRGSRLLDLALRRNVTTYSVAWKTTRPQAFIVVDNRVAFIGDALIHDDMPGVSAGVQVTRDPKVIAGLIRVITDTQARSKPLNPAQLLKAQYGLKR